VKHTITRRQFVKGLVASATAPSIISATALGKDGATPAGERITIGQIGCGKFGCKRHLSMLLAMRDVQVVAVCEVDRTRREDARAKVERAYSKNKPQRGCFATEDFRKLLARSDIDAVSIATPDHWHAIPVIKACKAGKDVYCEKPLTLTISEAQRCIKAVNKHQRVFQTGSQQRSSQEFRRAAELIRSGRLGDIQRITIGVGKPSRWCDLPEEETEPGLNWDMWLGQAPMRPYNPILSPRGVHTHFPAWRAYREYSGGAHSDIGAHHYDIAQWALDMDGSGPVEIIPPEQAGATKGVRYIYENGTEMIHGGPTGCEFFGANFYDWPQGAEMLGGLFRGHPWRSDGTWAVKIDEPKHPLCKAFGGKGFLIKEEIYRFRDPDSRSEHKAREKLRVLVSLDMTKQRNQLDRVPGENAIAWIREWGNGRVFYCSLGHNAEIFLDPKILQFYLDGIQYALGDLQADATPSAKLAEKPEPALCSEL